MKNIFVYDNRKYFFLLLKRKYSKEYNLYRLKKNELIHIENFSPEDIGVFVVHKDDDIIDFFNFHACFDNRRILVCSEKQIFFEKYYKLFNLICLDISKPKNKYYKELNIRIERFSNKFNS